MEEDKCSARPFSWGEWAATMPRRRCKTREKEIGPAEQGM